MNSNEINLQQEAEYVLGMMDLYQKDPEIVAMLKMKGFSDEQVEKVLAVVKQEGYEKRINQAKKILMIGIIITIAMGVVWLLLQDAGIYNKQDDILVRVNSRLILKAALIGFVFGLVQAIYGTYRFIIYTARFKKLKTYI